MATTQSSSELPESPSHAQSPILAAVAGQTCCDDSWEAAYARFESSPQEIRKFQQRLQKLGASQWPVDAKIVELFCGRGNGLHALASLGFRDLEGVDLSASLVAQYLGPARMFIADCRQLPFSAGTKDIVVVQGGLHHLSSLPDDLEKTLEEVRRVLRDGGRFVLVEPWLTPFLRLVHFVCSSRIAQRLWPKMEALATMIRHEQQTYDQWLSRPAEILAVIERFFTVRQRSIGWGKLMLVGEKCRDQ